MKIALLGYGKMGQLVENVAVSRGHEVIQKINLGDSIDPNILRTADVAIDFSAPDVVVEHIYQCFDVNTPIIVGTTGWYGEIQQIKNDCLKRNNSLLYGSNFSVGVNILFRLNRYLAEIMKDFPEYDVQLEEIHHTEKKDSPSGTAMTLAENIVSSSNTKVEWINIVGDDLPAKRIEANQLVVRSERVANVPGTHTVLYSSETDSIEIKHIANNRNGFALGAVIAAEWMENKQGFYTIEDVFTFDKNI